MASARRYTQVALAHLRWWPMQLYVLGAAAFTTALFLTPPWTQTRPNPSQLITFAVLLWIAAGGAAIVTALIKAQLANPQARLTPDYRTPHLILAGVAMAVLTFGLAALVAQRLGVSMLGTMAIVSLVVASTAWWVQLQNVLIGLLVNALWLSLLNRRLVFAVGNVIYGHSDGLALVLLAIGVGSLVALWIRLARLHEAMPEYARRLAPHPRLDATATAQSRGLWLESFIRRPIETRCIAAANLWARARHLRATGLGRMSWLMAAGLAASMMIVPLLTGGSAPAEGALESFMVITGMLPPLLVFGHWSRRWPALGYESLRPTSRSRFIREVGLAIGLDLAEAWTLITLAGIAPFLIVTRANWPDLVFGGFFALSAAMAVVVFAMNAWILRLRSTVLSVIALALTGLAPLLPHLVNRKVAASGMTGPLALGLLVVGVLIALDAYARWCRTELE